jgi:hypothetical protein
MMIENTMSTREDSDQNIVESQPTESLAVATTNIERESAGRIGSRPKKTFESIPSSLHILLRKLQFISMCEPGSKPLFTQLTFTSAGLMGAMQRTWYGESRTTMLGAINTIFDEVARVLQDTRHQELIVEHISSAKLGVEKLIDTYSGCPDVTSSLIITLKNIDILLDRYSDLK